MFIYPIVESKFDHLRKTLALEVFLDSPNKSLIVSTLLVRFPLCKLAAHAQGYAKNEMLSILGFKSEALQDCYKSFSDIVSVAKKDMDLMMLNKIIVNYTSDIRSTFLSDTTNYGVQVDQIGLTYPNLAVSFVNRWVDRESMKRISDVLDMGDIDYKTSILIVNAGYLKVTWEFPFDMRLTKNVKFHHHDGNISMVPMMTRTDTYLHLTDPFTDAMFVNLKLACFGLSLTIAVPSTRKALTKLLSQLFSHPDTLQGVYRRMQYGRVSVMLPRFKVKTGVEWNKYLREIGLLKVFNETNSGLNGILSENSQIKNMYLSKVKQKNFIDVDEMGVYRQKIDDARHVFNEPYPLRANRGPREHHGPQIRADHPFLFIVNLQKDHNDRLDLHELFTGVYYGPGY
nr:serine protease inhibitor 3/4-like [Maniola hyperantus]